MKNIGIFILSITVTLSIIFLFDEIVKIYEEYKNPIYAGKRMFYINNEGNPFEKQDTTFLKILDVKGEYILFERTHKDFKDTSSSSIRYVKHYKSL